MNAPTPSPRSSPLSSPLSSHSPAALAALSTGGLPWPPQRPSAKYHKPPAATSAVTAQPRLSHPKRPGTVVGLGASAGGLESLGRLLSGLPVGFPAPVLVVLHLDPHHRSHAVALLQRRTRLPVRVAREGLRPKGGTVYIAPPDRHLLLKGGRMRLSRSPRVNYSRPSIDRLFTSLANDRGPAAIVAVLSGAGSDGADGLLAVKSRGGLAIAEDPDTAAFSGMPRAAVRTGLLDTVLPVAQIPAFLLRTASQRVKVSQRQWLQALALLEQKTGTRFAKYRSSTLHRRLHQRLAARGSRTMEAYLRVLERDPAELDRLQAAFLIKVSAFARDPASWASLARALAPLARRGGEVRAWSAGCATGEEAYTLALMLARLLGTGPEARWKVFGTDLDEGALRVARAGLYTQEQVRGVSKADLAAHFVRRGEAWQVGPALRAHVVFGKNDLLHDPPLSNMDVLACRNVLIYFQPKEKQQTLRRLAAALAPGGLLFLGRSEALSVPPGVDRVGHTTLFRERTLRHVMTTRKTPDDAGAKAPRAAPRSRPGKRPSGGDDRFLAQQDLNEELQSRNEELETVNEELQSLNDEMSTMEEQMRGLAEEAQRANDFLRLLLDTSADVLVACDAGNNVTFWNKAAVKRFRLSAAQAVGGELFDLVPALSTPKLRAAVRKVRAAGRGGRVTVQDGGLEYQLDPLPAGKGKRRSYLMRAHAKRA